MKEGEKEGLVRREMERIKKRAGGRKGERR